MILLYNRTILNQEKLIMRETFILSVENLDKQVKQETDKWLKLVKSQLDEPMDLWPEKSSLIGFPYNRAKRIISHLEKIKDNYLDQLTEDDFRLLITISNTTAALFVFHEDSCLISPSMETKRSAEFKEMIFQYKKAAEKINNKFGTPYKQLAGEVLKYLGLLSIACLAIATFSFPIVIPISSLLFQTAMGVSIVSGCAGLHASRHTLFSQLKSDVYKTSFSDACNEKLSTEFGEGDPDCPLLTSLYGKLYASRAS